MLSRKAIEEKQDGVVGEEADGSPHGWHYCRLALRPDGGQDGGRAEELALAGDALGAAAAFEDIDDLGLDAGDDSDEEYSEEDSAVMGFEEHAAFSVSSAR